MEDVRVRISLDSSQFDSGVSQAEGALSGLKGRMGEVGKGLQNVGSNMAAVGAGMVGAVGGIAAAGSKWQASVESTQFLYKNLDKTVQKSIKNNAENARSLGMTEQQYKSNATSLATFLGNMGFANDEISNMSGEAMTLAADLGAVADVPIDQAMGDMKSALMGNYEAMDKYGVNLSAATLENSEYVESLGKSWKQLSDNEKMQAAYAEIMKQSSSANGLAKQEAGSFGMQMKLLKESVGEAVGKLGAELLPVLEPIIKKFQEVVQNITKWVEENPELARTVLMIVGAVGAFLAIAGTLIAVVGAIIGVFLLFQAATAPVTLTVLGIVVAITALVAAGIWLAANWDTVKAKAIEVWGAIKKWISDSVQATKNKITEIWTNIQTWCSNTWNRIKSTAITIWEGIKTAIQSKVDGAKQKVQDAWTRVKEGTKQVFDTVKTIVTNIWDSIKTTISDKVTAVKDNVKKGFDGLKDSVKTALDKVYDTAKGIWDSITGIFKNPIKAIVNFVKGGDKSVVAAGSKGLKTFSNLGYAGATSYMARAGGGLSLAGSGGAPTSFNANMSTTVQLDGKTIARASAPYMRSELDKLNKRKNRLGGK